jgi:hypothetical protein
MLSLACVLLLQVSSANLREPVKITTEQASLLRSEARSILTHAFKTREKLQATWEDKNFEVRKDVLLTSVSGASDSVSRVKSLFLNMSTGFQQRRSAEIFFNNISRRYEYVRGGISDWDAQKYTLVWESVFETFEQNASAYLAVADDGSLTFDLDVNSSPQEASVSYKLYGDSYKNHPNPTNTTIQNLEYATWIVRVHKEGYKDQEKTHDPSKEKNHVLYFILEKQ